MSRPQNAHVSDDEIERLLEADSAASEGVQAHLESCQDCARALAMNREGNRALELIRGTVEPGGPDCPPPQIWWEIAAGLRNDFDELLQHASSCQECGEELRAALEAKVASESETSPSPLESAPARAALAKRMAKQSNATRKSTPPIPMQSSRKSYAIRYGVIAAIAIAAAWGTWFAFRAPATDLLIARGYEEKRTVEFRVSGANHAEMRVERGPAAERPLPLKEAEVEVDKALKKAPDDPRFLQQQARIELLNGNYQSALRRVTRAVELQPDDPNALEDLALAYFERAQAENRPIDYGAAVETLARILAKRPDDPVALFNRAIGLEYLMVFREAAKDWEHFLKVEPKGGWADEARARLEAIQKKLQARRDASKRCTDMTAAIVIHWNERGELRRQLEAWEDGWACFRQRAIVDWLPAMRSAENREALRIADVTFRTATGDTWFGDMLAQSTSPRFAEGAAELGRAVAANQVVDVGHAEAAARKAEQIFQQIGNDAGMVQAAIELDYAIRRVLRASECQAALAPVEQKLAGHTWAWTSLQAQLEQHQCLNISGQREGARRLVQNVISLSSHAAYRGLRLRALSYLAEIERQTAEHPASWDHDLEGLRAFWAGHEAPVWAYQLYFHLGMEATVLNRSRLALHLHRETLAEIMLAGRPMMEALEWFDYGRAAENAESTGEARLAFSTALRSFDKLPSDRGILTIRAGCEIYLAEIDNHEGRPLDAIVRLNRVAQQMADTNSGFDMRLRFRRAMAEADRLLIRRKETEQDLKSLIETSEKGLLSLSGFTRKRRWAHDTAESYREFVAFLALEKQQPEQALDAWEWFHSAAFREIDSRPQAGSALRSFRKLGISQALVYAALEDRLLIWHLRSDSVDMHVVNISRTKLAALSRRLYILCSDPTSALSGIVTTARELANVLLAPVEAGFSWDRPLWINLDEVLDAVPVTVLPTKRGDPLGARVAVVGFPGLEYLERTQPPGDLRSGTPLVSVGISTKPNDVTAYLAPLPDAEVEARQVAMSLPGAHVLINEDATRANIERELSAANVFHFAGHGRTNADQTALMVTGKPSWLSAEEAAGMDLRKCRLAVISACSVEAPELFSESRPFGFALALLEARASNVLATRWNLDSQTGLTYMRTFYRAIAQGDGVAASSKAAADTIRKSPSTSHPYYWAAYQLFGRG